MNVNIFVDNAKSRAAVPRTVHVKAPRRVSRWDSVVRTESNDTADISSHRAPLDSRNCHSLSPTGSSPKAARNPGNCNTLSPPSIATMQKSVHTENSQTQIKDKRWDEGRSEMPPLPTRPDKNLTRSSSEPILRIPQRKEFLRPDLARRRSFSEPLLRIPQRKDFIEPDFVRERSIPQRKAFVDSKPVAPRSRRTRIRPSTRRQCCAIRQRTI